MRKTIVFVTVCLILVGCMSHRTQTPFDLSVRDLYFGFHSSDLIVDVGTENWEIDSVRVNDRVYPVPSDIRERQKLAQWWDFFTARWIRLRYYSPRQMRIMINTSLNEFFDDKEHSFCIYLKKAGIKDSITGKVEPPYEGGEWWPVVTSYRMDFEKTGGSQTQKTDRFCKAIKSVRLNGKNLEIDVSENATSPIEIQWKRTFDWLTIEVSGKSVTLTTTPNDGNEERTFDVEFYNINSITHISGEQ